MGFRGYVALCVLICILLFSSCSRVPAVRGSASLKAVHRVTPGDSVFSKGAFVNFHYMMAYFYFSNGNISKAVRELKMVLSVADNPYFFKEYINMLTYTGDIGAMVSGFKEAISKFPNIPYFYLRMAGVLAVEGRIGRAIRVLRKAYVRFPKNAQVLEMLGFTYIKYNNYTMGMKFLRKAIKYSKDKAKIYLFMGSVFKNLGFYDKAIENAKKALEIKHSYVNAVLLIGSVYEAEGSFDRAIRFYRRWLYLKEPAICSALANDYYHLREYSKAEYFFRRALKMNPYDPTYLEKACYIYMQQGKLKELVELARKYVYTSAYSDRVKYLVGVAYRKLGECNKALFVLRSISPASKIYPRVAGEMAVCLVGLKHYGEAESVLGKAVSMYPDKKFLYMMLSYVFELERKYDDRIKILLKAANRFRENSIFYFYAADTYFVHKHSIKMAIKYLKLSIESNPKNADALNYLGYLYIDKNIDVGRGVKLVERALKLQPNNPAFIDSLGWGYYKLGRYKKALELLEKAVSLIGKEEGNYVIDIHLAYAYYSVGRRSKALSIIRRVLKHHKSSQAEELLKKLQ